MSKQHCRSNVRLCRKDEISTQNSFDIVAVFWQQSRTLLRHCCWCGPGFSCLIVELPFTENGTQVLSTMTFTSIKRARCCIESPQKHPRFGFKITSLSYTFRRNKSIIEHNRAVVILLRWPPIFCRRKSLQSRLMKRNFLKVTLYSLLV